MAEKLVRKRECFAWKFATVYRKSCGRIYSPKPCTTYIHTQMHARGRKILANNLTHSKRTLTCTVHTHTHIHCSFNSYFIYLMKLRHVECGTLQIQGGVGRMEKWECWIPSHVFICGHFFGVSKYIQWNYHARGFVVSAKLWCHIKYLKNVSICILCTEMVQVQVQKPNSAVPINLCVVISFAIFIFSVDVSLQFDTVFFSASVSNSVYEFFFAFYSSPFTFACFTKTYIEMNIRNL